MTNTGSKGVTSSIEDDSDDLIRRCANAGLLYSEGKSLSDVPERKRNDWLGLACAILDEAFAEHGEETMQ